ncbi:Crp/Fnr family transcriptional regulator [Bdellovibrio sp. ZAP7]|uniref:Crp/Fnr family transcriptional regulator n=1 Tax=Bdellovibrio sp. ZAP7 TaxID=2231053 RepID=UPI00115A283A|nr:Crp/Fnr family transcriptional regulator [Bdellovibrio sp. ZAP7]QDK46145.1 Crp/Fnr family transcriptional regulator [Bdellovibrio sp. ZAP7]
MQLKELLDKAQTLRRFKAGQVIFEAGGEPQGLYKVHEGLIKLDSTSASGAAHTLRLIGPEGLVGYRALFAGENYYATAIAVEESVLSFVSKNEILALFRDHPEAAMQFLEFLSRDLRLAESKWTGQMDKDAAARIADALLFLQQNFPQQNWTRKEIAQWAGTTPETVIRTLATFEKEGIIDQSSGRTIQIKNRELLLSKSAEE